MRDANGQQFWQRADAGDWIPGDPAVEYDVRCRHLRLRDRRPRRASRGTPGLAEAERRSRLPARARDAFGTMAWWDGAAILASGAVTSATPPSPPSVLWRPSAGTEVRDLAMGYDGVLYVAVREPDSSGGERFGLRLVDRRGRWREPVFVGMGMFTPERLAADPAGGVWALDVTHRQMARFRGKPLTLVQSEMVMEFDATTFRPVPEDPDPMRMVMVDSPGWETGEVPVSMAMHAGGLPAILTWRGADESWLYIGKPEGGWRAARRLSGDDRIYSIAWLSDERVAGLPAPRTEPDGTPVPVDEALVYSINDSTPELVPGGDFHPVRGGAVGVWVQGVALPPHYPVGLAASAALVSLNSTHYTTAGLAYARVIETDVERPTWHRLQVEAVIPPGCGFVVELAVSENTELPAEAVWWPHWFGAGEPIGGAAGLGEPVPRGVLGNGRSEIPAHPGLIGDEAEGEPRGTMSGAFSVLVQRMGMRVRDLRGRCLHVRVRLHGPGHATPRIFALRVWGSRFSYRDRHLPELYRETEFGPAGEVAGPATPADFLGRFLGLFEGVLTPVEDRVVSAHIVTDPRSAPVNSLDWLGGWVGEEFDGGFPADRRRAWLTAAPWLRRAHGTMSGLQLALEIATGGTMVRRFSEEARCEVEFPTGGGVTGGEIVVVEEFRLRRTAATILGANLGLPDDPLLPGLIASSNSRVGDTLILGEEARKEFIALFRNAFSDDTVENAAEATAVQRLFERFANRVTILVHTAYAAMDLALIRRVADRMAPAHVEVTVVAASTPLLVGLSSLVDVDTYLVPRPPRDFARVGTSRVGVNTFVQRLPALDPRLGGGRAGGAWTGSGETGAPGAVAPTARISAPLTLGQGEQLTLDGSGSSAGPGRTLTEFTWTKPGG